MKNLLHLALLLLATTAMANSNTTKVDFIKGSLSLAVQKAGNEGKLLFVEFGAKWCMPCRFMDENTFSNQEVIQYMSENYVPVKIDIDDFDGFAYKQKYQVQALPTFLVMTSTGQVIERYESSMAPSNLLKILQQHNKSINRQKISTELDAFEIEAQLHEAQKAKYNVSPYDAAPIPSDSSENSNSNSGAKISENTTNELTTQDISDLPDMPRQTDSDSDSDSDLPEAPRPAGYALDMINIETSDELLWESDESEVEASQDDEELLEFEFTDQSQTLSFEEPETYIEESSPSVIFYTVKIGGFDNEHSKNEFIKVTSSVFVEDTHIFEYDRDGLMWYDVCLGTFATESSANDFIDRLGFLNISGEIKRIEH